MTQNRCQDDFEMRLFRAVSDTRAWFYAGTPLIDGARSAATAYQVPYTDVVRHASRAIEGCRLARETLELASITRGELGVEHELAEWRARQCKARKP